MTRFGLNEGGGRGDGDKWRIRETSPWDGGRRRGRERAGVSGTMPLSGWDCALRWGLLSEMPGCRATGEHVCIPAGARGLARGNWQRCPGAGRRGSGFEKSTEEGTPGTFTFKVERPGRRCPQGGWAEGAGGPGEAPMACLALPGLGDRQHL